MPQLSFFRILLIALVCFSSLLFASPNFFYSTVDKKLNNPTQTSSWPDFLPSTLVKLGLDLRGGVYMLLEVKTDDVELVWEISRNNQLFPHLYSPLPLNMVSQVYRIFIDDEGKHIIPEQVLNN